MAYFIIAFNNKSSKQDQTQRFLLETFYKIQIFYVNRIIRKILIRLNIRLNQD